MAFVAITLEDYVGQFMRANPGSQRAQVVARLRDALSAHRSGVRCACGEPIWVLAAAEAGYSCFTCITGESAPVDDYELADALEGRDV